MNRKNHYQTLGLMASASQEKVKTTFRKLALQFHPDKNPDSAIAESRFREIREAYEIIGDPQKRKAYDLEFWLNIPGKRPAAASTPLSVLKEAIRLRQYVSSVNLFGIDHEALSYQILKILSDQHLLLLLEHRNEKLNGQVVSELIQASGVLKFRYIPEIIGRMKKLMPAKEPLAMISKYEKSRIAADYTNRFSPVLVLLIVLLLCWLIYLYGR